MIELNTEDERAVSPVIGVILMVAITVILAAVIGAFVLNIGSDVQRNVQAGANVNVESGNIYVSYSSTQKSNTKLEITVDGTDEGTLTDVGDSKTLTGYSGTVRVVVTAVNGDKRSTIYSKDLSIT